MNFLLADLNLRTASLPIEEKLNDGQEEQQMQKM